MIKTWKISETTTTVTFGFQPVPGYGYVLYDNQGRRISNSWDEEKNQWRVDKGRLPVTIASIDHTDTGVYPPVVPPPNQFGAYLPPRIARSTGTLANVATEQELLNAVATVAPGTIINITQSLQRNMGTLNITRNATPQAPITITSNPDVTIKNYASWNVSGSYLRFQGLEFYCDLPPDPNGAGAGALCPRSGGHHIEISRCLSHGLPAGNNSANGFYIGSGAGDNNQIWDSEMYWVGRANGLDHGIYWSTSPSNGVIANCLIYQPYSYGIQIYPKVRGMILTGCTIDGGQTGMADPRGGVVIGDDGGGTTQNVTSVGCVVTNAPGTAAFHIEKTAAGSKVYDSLSFNNKGDFNISNENCVVADPLYVNRAARDYRLKAGSPAIGLVQPARYGLLPPTYRDGTPRLTGVAGSEAPA